MNWREKPEEEFSLPTTKRPVIKLRILVTKDRLDLLEVVEEKEVIPHLLLTINLPLTVAKAEARPQEVVVEEEEEVIHHPHLLAKNHRHRLMAVNTAEALVPVTVVDILKEANTHLEVIHSKEARLEAIRNKVVLHLPHPHLSPLPARVNPSGFGPILRTNGSGKRKDQL